MARIRLLRVHEIAHITSTGKPPVNLPGTLYLLLLLHSTGETPWLKDMIEKYDEIAKGNGSIVRIPRD